MALKSIHHTFDIDLATEYGVNESILIHHFQYWITINKKLNRNLHEGSYWTYQSLDEIAAHFPYWSRSEIFEIIERLCTGKRRRSKKEDLLYEPVLKKGNFNKSAYDRTIWYSFVDEPKWILAITKMDNSTCQNGNCELPTPIPDTIPNTKTNIKPPTPLKGEERDCVSFGKFVKIEKEAYQELSNKYGNEVITNLIEEINDYLSSSGKKPYKDYAAVLRTWIKRRSILPSIATPGLNTNQSFRRPKYLLNQDKTVFACKVAEKMGLFKDKRFRVAGHFILNLDTKEDLLFKINPEEFVRCLDKMFNFQLENPLILLEGAYDYEE